MTEESQSSNVEKPQQSLCDSGRKQPVGRDIRINSSLIPKPVSKEDRAGAG